MLSFGAVCPLTQGWFIASTAVYLDIGSTSNKRESRSFADGDRFLAHLGNRNVNFDRTKSSDGMEDESSSNGKQPHNKTKTMTPSAQVSTALE
mmetsp:Transcript_26155/g.40003  ORF Transcript_26155/g.40003 Transcript_26155/m.40003 type:complete len:93 (+) Transcript_26155:369-647(+)